MTTLIVIWLICGVITAAIGSAKGRGALDSFMWGAVFGIFGLIYVAVSKPPAPKGMRAVTCSRCSTTQNIPMNQAQFECWQCKAPGGTRLAGTTG